MEHQTIRRRDTHPRLESMCISQRDKSQVLQKRLLYIKSLLRLKKTLELARLNIVGHLKGKMEMVSAANRVRTNESLNSMANKRAERERAR